VIDDAEAGVAFRHGTALDASELTQLARDAKAHWGYPPEWLAEWGDDLALTPDYIASHQVFVAESVDEDAVVGVCALAEHGDHWQLEHVWVAPASQRRGVGRALVDQALSVARARRPDLTVRVHADPNAVGFYERLGARRIGRIEAPMPGAPSRDLPVLEFVADR
jgi:ribosomal protein S18 acetylase RimI-like enzyme